MTNKKPKTRSEIAVCIALYKAFGFGPALGRELCKNGEVKIDGVRVFSHLEKFETGARHTLSLGISGPSALYGADGHK